ncbi:MULTISPECIES: DUF2846 domain-containing protein [unclassified Duganella]|uniref:DUF2846 domain-containing protein n=1 Tax=unclassified Duganella TaxID=2636909 RepID=UPI0007010B74|nr:MULTISPECIES: DUF2846 domain-containing protein [unclassified Duganella]KQV53689.1 hypothetical protein ASD07_03790 [Duganella sp. Root336D2]KRB83756.1 hypothetical protein ASE26_11390 [Duganella sp. Root198D2]
MKCVSLAGIAAMALLTGCTAVSGTRFAQQEAVMPKLSAGQGRVYFYRVDAFTGGGMAAPVMLDGMVAGDSLPGGYFFVDAAAGKHEASATTRVTRKLNFVLEPGETKYVRTKAQFEEKVGRVVLELVGAEEARRELPSLNFTGAPKAN